MKKVWKFLCAIQETMESNWPLPVKGSMLNVSVRDLIYSLLIIAVTIRLHWALVIAALFVEPALACFPYNILHSLVVYSPRFWDFRAVDPKLELFLHDLPSMRSEALSVADQAIPFSSNKHQLRIAEGQPWNVFSFVSYGTINYANCAKCPTIASLVLQIPSIKFAMLSIMEGDTRIKRHCGYFKNVLRCHITLHVDNEEDSLHVRYIDVGGEKYHWKQGEMVVFDDTYPHTVVNTVPGKRIVLFLDVERPYSSKSAKWISKAFLDILHTSRTLAEASKFQEKNSARNGI